MTTALYKFTFTITITITIGRLMHVCAAELLSQYYKWYEFCGLTGTVLHIKTLPLTILSCQLSLKTSKYQRGRWTFNI